MSCKAAFRVPKEKGHGQPPGDRSAAMEGRPSSCYLPRRHSHSSQRPTLLLLSPGIPVSWHEDANSRGERPHVRVLAAATQAFPTNSQLQRDTRVTSLPRTPSPPFQTHQPGPGVREQRGANAAVPCLIPDPRTHALLKRLLLLNKVNLSTRQRASYNSRH